MSFSSRLKKLVEPSPGNGVAAEDRRNWTFLASIQIGMTICIPLFALGGDLGQHQQAGPLFVNILLSCVLITLMGILTGLVGLHSRLPTALLVRHTFGEWGSRLVALILMITLFGWFGVQTEVLVHSFLVVTKHAIGVDLNATAVTWISGLLMATTAIIGAKALGRISYAAVPLLLLTFMVPSVIALRHHGVDAMHQAMPAQPYSTNMVISIMVGGHMLTVTVLPDVTRFLRHMRDNVVGCVVSFLVALPLLLLMSSLLAMIYGSADLIQIMIGAGVGIPALLVIFLATWTSNDKNLYESALSMSALFPRVARWKLTVIGALIGTGLATVGIFSHFITLLVILGITVAPMTGAYMMDFVMDRSRYTTDPDGARLRWASLAAWAFGLVVSLMTLPADQYGFGWFSLTGIPALDGLLASALLRALVGFATGRATASTAA